MATNPYINRVDVVRGNSTDTLINISDTTAVASDVASGKYFYLASGEKVAGTSSGGGGGSVTQDANGFIVLPETGGGGSGESWSWMGKNPTLVKTYAKEKVYFKDTDFPSWTWSTSQSDIVAAAAYADTVALDMSQYDYMALYRLYVHTDYGNWTPVNAVTDFCFIATYDIYGSYSSLQAKESGTYNAYKSSSGVSYYTMYYKSNSGTTTWYEGNYGLYSISQPSGSLSGSGTTRTLTLTKPKLVARGNATYFSQDAFNNVDMNASYYEVVTEIWRVDAPTMAKAAIYEMSLDTIDNGL